MTHEFRGRGFDSGFAPPVQQRRQHDATPTERAQTAASISSNLEHAHVAVVESIEALARAHDARDVAGYATARQSSESAVERVRHLANGAMAHANDATDPQVRAKLEQAAALAEVATQNLAAAPAAPEPVAPTLRNEGALLAALPPAEIDGPTKLVFDAARQSTRSALLQMPFSDYGAMEKILAEFPTHEVAVRFRKFKSETQGELRAILKDSKARVRARSIEASMPKLAPPPPAFTAPTVAELIAPPPAFRADSPSADISNSPTSTETAVQLEQPQKLPDGIRGELEQATGRSLGHVRVHAGNDGATVAAKHGARAVAIGQDIHVAEGQLDPTSAEGRELIAHEVGHVLQADARTDSRKIAANRDSAGDDNAAEADADRFAATFRADGASTKWEPSVSVTGATALRAPVAGQATRTTDAEGKTSAPTPIVRVDQNATTKTYAREYVTADAFLSLWATELLDVTVKNLGPTPPQPHARLRWTDAANTIALIASNLYSSRGRFAADDRGLLVRLFYPMDLHALVDRYRDLRPPPPGHEAEGPLGTSAWQTAIGDSIAAEARPRLDEAIHRAGQRYVAAADKLHSSGTRAEQAIKEKLAADNAILPHTPLDYVVLLAMRDPNVVTYTPPAAKSPREVANNELRPLSITCMGAQDPALWYVLRVDTPGTTVEQVAAVLFNRSDDATAHSYDADLIVDAAPFYILPKEWAATVQRIGGQLGPAAYEPKDVKKQRELSRYNPEAAQRTTAQEALDPRTVLAESALADEIALAQNDLVTRRLAAEKPADKKHKVGKDDAASETILSVDAANLITRGRGQLEYLRDLLALWSLTKDVTTAADFLTRVEEKTTHSEVLNASWSSLLAHHGQLLSQISERVASFVKEVGKPATAGGDPETPIGRVLAKYARAAGAAHQVGSGSALLGEAEQARQGVLLATIELAVQSSGYAVSQERASEHHARDVDGDSLHLEDTQKSVRMRAAQMRNALAQGKGVDAGEAEELILEAEENRLIASVSTLKVQLREFKSEADKGTLGILPGFVQSTELLNMRLDAPYLITGLDNIHEFLKDGHKIIYAPRSPKDAADPSLPDVATRKRENLRQFVQSAHTKLDALKQEQQIEHFLQRADQVLADQRWRVMVGEAAAMIGVGLVTGGVASFVGGAVRGAMLLDLSADAVGLVKTVRMARAFGTAAELVTDTTLSGVAQHALTGGDTAIGENILSNALTRFALSPLGRLTSGLGDVDKKAFDAWQRIGNGAQFVLGKGIQLSAEMLTGTAIGYAVHRIAAWKRGEQPSDEMVDSWLLQGASFAVGRFLNGRLHHRMQQLEKLGQKVGRLPQRMQVLADRAAQLERSGTPDEALDLLIEHRAIVDEEIVTIARLQHEGVLRPNEAEALRADAHADGEVIKGQGFVAIQARAAGLEPVVEGAGRWAGDVGEIITMMRKARGLGLDVQILESGNQQKRWRVRFGEDVLEFEERAATKGPPKKATGEPEVGHRGSGEEIEPTPEERIGVQRLRDLLLRLDDAKRPLEETPPDRQKVARLSDEITALLDGLKVTGGDKWRFEGLVLKRLSAREQDILADQFRDSRPSRNHVGADTNKDGISDGARVGVPAMEIPDKIPRLENLPPDAAAAQERFASAYEKQGGRDLLAKEYLRTVRTAEDDGRAKSPEERKTFATDDAKRLSPDYQISDGTPAEKNAAKAKMNLAVHQTANAVAKQAFIMRLDDLAMTEPGATVMVTAGGVAAGKSHAIGNNADAKSMVDRAAVIWDSAGEQNSTELPWVIAEAKKRGLVVEILYVHQDPGNSWPRVVDRAKKHGRMVDARLHAESYEQGAKNFDAVQRRFPEIKTVVVDVSNEKQGPKKIDRLSDDALDVDVDTVHQRNSEELRTRQDVSGDIKQGGMEQGEGVWGAPNHRAVIAELGEIPIAYMPSGAIVEGTTQPLDRSTYYVNAADGKRMLELSARLAPSVETRSYKKGFLLRRTTAPAGEWYFEFRDLATTGTSPLGASREAGLPPPNAATVELWGFSGVRTIKGRPKSEWTPQEQAEFKRVKEFSPLMWAGHIGISLDGGKTIIGFTPDMPRGMTTEEGIAALLRHEAFPGVLGNDTAIFLEAAALARDRGWDTHMTVAVELVDTPAKMKTVEEVARLSGVKPGEHGYAYSFPLDSKQIPPGGEAFAASNGFPANCVRNCGAFPAKLGVKIPEPTGQVKAFLPELQKWASQDGPVDTRSAGTTGEKKP